MAYEPEFIAHDGTVRKEHYGRGEQPWDVIVRLGWAPHFAASNVLKYVRRHTGKNGADDLAKARWYYVELCKMADMCRDGVPLPQWKEGLAAVAVRLNLMSELSEDEQRLLLDGATGVSA